MRLYDRTTPSLNPLTSHRSTIAPIQAALERMPAIHEPWGQIYSIAWCHWKELSQNARSSGLRW